MAGAADGVGGHGTRAVAAAGCPDGWRGRQWERTAVVDIGQWAPPAVLTGGAAFSCAACTRRHCRCPWERPRSAAHELGCRPPPARSHLFPTVFTTIYCATVAGGRAGAVDKRVTPFRLAGDQGFIGSSLPFITAVSYGTGIWLCSDIDEAAARPAAAQSHFRRAATAPALATGGSRLCETTLHL